MANMVVLTGNMGSDPEIRYMPSGDAIANVRLATSEKYRNKDGEMKEQTEWHRVVFFGKSAENVGEYTKKGTKLYIRGKIRTRKFQDKSGEDRYITEIHADEWEILTGGDFESRGSRGKPDSGHGRGNRDEGDASQTPPGGDDTPEGDIPF